MNTPLMVGLLVLAASTSIIDAGDFSGQYVFVGGIPQPDVQVQSCAGGPLVDESLKIDAISKGIANIVVYLPKAPAGTPPLPNGPAPVLDQQACQFVPRVMTVRAGQVPLVKSNDPFPHNVRSSFIRNAPFNFAVGGVNRIGVPCNGIIQAEPVPMPIRCDIHPHMLAFWVILDHPYMAITDKDGKFTIKDLPPGKHKFRVWHEKAGYIARSLSVEITKEVDVTLPLAALSSEDFK